MEVRLLSLSTGLRISMASLKEGRSSGVLKQREMRSRITGGSVSGRGSRAPAYPTAPTTWHGRQGALQDFKR